VTTPKTAEKRPAPRSKRAPRTASRAKTTKRPAAGPAARPPKKTATAARPPKKAPTPAPGRRTITVTVPPIGEMATRAVSAAAVPVTTARRALPAKGGLPLYAGLGALAVFGALEWPLAVGIGIGYAVLKHNGLLEPPAGSK
jgi:hypothetical protein